MADAGSSVGTPSPGPEPALAWLASSGPAAVLVVESSTRLVVHANALARHLAPGVGLPVDLDVWSGAAGLRGPRGGELAGDDDPPALLAPGAATTTAASARLAAGAGAAREPMFAFSLPLDGSSGLAGHTLLVLLPLRDADADAAKDRAVLAAGCSFSVASATAPDQPLTWVNPGFSLTTGYPAEEVIGRNCRFLQGPGTDPEQVGMLRAALLAGQDATVVLLNYRKDGTAFWNQLSVSPVLDAAGTVTHYVGVQTDVTDRVEAERIGERALQAERAARAEADRARSQAEVLNQRMTLMSEVTNLLAATFDTEQSLDRLARLVVPWLADGVVINLVDERGRLGRSTVARHFEGREDLLRRSCELILDGADPDSPLHDLLTGGPPTLLRDVEPTPAVGPGETGRELRRISVELGTHSQLFVPLTARRRLVGTMILAQGPSRRQFDHDDLELAADLGRRAGLALDNARLYTREHETGLALQRSLLPALPQISGLALAAQYLPAGQASQVGGDWWDVFSLPDGATGLAVGDVMGHDIAAAAAMGQLRSVLRTCAWAGDDPATVLERMDRLVQGFDMAQLATCFYARLEAADGPDGRRRLPRLSWSNAGHLPPIVLGPDGRARLLHSAGDVPIGVPSPTARGREALSVTPGSTLLLYTDGLVETRGGDIDVDVEELRRRVALHRPADGPAVLVETLVAAATDLADDVALLALQIL